MERIRLTKRMQAESQADGLFPGDVGNMERSKNYHEMDEYDNYEQTINYELPDMRHDWKENPRNEVGMGIPKVAKVYIAAQKAVKMAMMFLGDNADEKTVEAQARDFMKLGDSRLTASIDRWVATEEEVPAEEVPVEEVKEEAPVAPVATAEVAPVVAPVVAEDKVDEVVAPVAPAVETPAVTEEKEEDVAVDAADEEVAPVEESDGINTEVDFDGNTDDGDVQADAELEGIFEDKDDVDDENNVAPEAPTASKKQGIKKIGCQPKLVRVASTKVDSLESLWTKLDAPNIN